MVVWALGLRGGKRRPVTLVNIVHDLIGEEIAAQVGAATGAARRLRRLELGKVGPFGIRECPVDAFAEEFGVAVVWNHACFEWLRFGEVARGLKPDVVGDR